jgi:4-hydroxy-tetrahydrodipicolinate reductase
VIRAAVAGACGRMGTAIIQALDASEGIELTGAIERPDHPCFLGGKDPMGTVCGKGIPVVFDHASLPSGLDVFIDFTTPEGTLKNVAYSAEHLIPAVVGTTGLTGEQVKTLTTLAHRVPVVFAPNMSIGVNLLFKLAATAAAVLGEAYDAEILETHHRMKKDAPSGTAIRLAESVAQARGRDLAETAVYERHGMIGQRAESEIGIQTLRAGDIVGEHTLLLAGPGERIELTHRAHSRENFALGAVRAAMWVIGKDPGLYSMAEVLGIH